MMNCLQSWPEPIVRVQSLSDSGIHVLPDRYIRHPSDRPSFTPISTHANIPVIDLHSLLAARDARLRQATLDRISGACREWGFFQVVNHGVRPELMKSIRQLWRDFFHLPLEAKQVYANSPATYEGYGSRLGVEKGAKLDWSDYFFLNYLPESARDENKWPTTPESCRELVHEYSKAVVELCGILMKILSVNLGLEEDHLQNAFGGDDVGACLRVNYYPKCPQPDLTLGISPHSDPGGMTILLPDDDVSGLQVRKGEHWVTVEPIPDALIVNLGDQIQVISNAIYKSVEHRVIVNSIKERVSLAYFYNPKGDLLIEPAKKLVSKDRPASYSAMTFDQYRLFIRQSGLWGKSQVESLKCSQ